MSSVSAQYVNTRVFFFIEGFFKVDQLNWCMAWILIDLERKLSVAAEHGNIIWQNPWVNALISFSVLPSHVRPFLWSAFLLCLHYCSRSNPQHCNQLIHNFILLCLTGCLFFVSPLRYSIAVLFAWKSIMAYPQQQFCLFGLYVLPSPFCCVFPLWTKSLSKCSVVQNWTRPFWWAWLIEKYSSKRLTARWPKLWLSHFLFFFVIRIL